jgi:hypothetical protein
VDFANLLLDHVVIVEQPLRGGGDVPAPAGGKSDGTIGIE